MSPDFETENTDLKIEFYGFSAPTTILHETWTPVIPREGDRVSLPSIRAYVLGVGWLIDARGPGKHTCVVMLHDE